ncbi:hypothetical protein OKW43_000828 [Paraburkholderia sp. WC7.3g]|uniref:Uncharacterized protein n=1 Tax=Paraburkholderia podalyriae TaxID=1938811 RepID=A0ABR7PKM4_9BURK|nr:hypothetical protein [Paraburkholderia podalyriae]MBC8746334.1 hypothetical protein [Paraburkholderia podalyriae]
MLGQAPNQIPGDARNQATTIWSLTKVQPNPIRGDILRQMSQTHNLLWADYVLTSLTKEIAAHGIERAAVTSDNRFAFSRRQRAKHQSECRHERSPLAKQQRRFIVSNPDCEVEGPKLADLCLTAIGCTTFVVRRG